MESTTIAGTGVRTSRLGYGCSSVMGGMGRRESLAILETAFDAGIRHFDVAPMYGFGEAEGCLGEFLARHRGHVTVTTKYGIPPAKGNPAKSLARNMARPVLKLLPNVKRRLAGVAAKVDTPAPRATFTPAQAKQSLDRSLAALRTDRVDIWLLHEVEAQDLNDDGLLRLLESEVASGTIRAFGVGSEGSKVQDLLRQRPEYCRILQYEWSIFDGAASSNAFRIHHRALTENFRSLHAALTTNPVICRRWSDNLGKDLGSAEVLASLMLKAALTINPESIILFSSKRPEHVLANVKVAEDASLEEPARRLYDLAQNRGHELNLTERSERG